MSLFPSLRMGWLNGWLLLAGHFVIQGGLLLTYPGDVVARLFDRSGWSSKQKLFTVIGKLFSLACLALIVLTPISTNPILLAVGLAVYAIGLAGLVAAMTSFRNTPMEQPVTKGVYRLSRHPQIVALFLIFLGICLAIGSGAALLALILSKLFQHLSILAEEEVCLKHYGETYRAYLSRVPRYLWPL